MNGITVICLGNPLRGDDGLGIEVAKRLSRKDIPGLKVIKAESDEWSIVEYLTVQGRLVVVDAVSSGMPPGTLHRYSAEQLGGTTEHFCSNIHNIGIASIIKVAANLGIKADFAFLGIEVQSTDFSEKLSPPVERALDGLIKETISFLMI